MKNAIAQLTTEMTRLHDVEGQLSSHKERMATLEDQKAVLQQEQLTASDYILEIEHKLYKANKTSLELIRLLKEAEGEIEKLKTEVEIYQREIIEIK